MVWALDGAEWEVTDAIAGLGRAIGHWTPSPMDLDNMSEDTDWEQLMHDLLPTLPKSWYEVVAVLRLDEERKPWTGTDELKNLIAKVREAQRQPIEV
jgi:hypothetical protein